MKGRASGGARWFVQIKELWESQRGRNGLDRSLRNAGKEPRHVLMNCCVHAGMKDSTSVRSVAVIHNGKWTDLSHSGRAAQECICSRRHRSLHTFAGTVCHDTAVERACFTSPVKFCSCASVSLLKLSGDLHDSGLRCMLLLRWARFESARSSCTALLSTAAQIGTVLVNASCNM